MRTVPTILTCLETIDTCKHRVSPRRATSYRGQQQPKEHTMKVGEQYTQVVDSGKLLYTESHHCMSKPGVLVSNVYKF